MTLDMLKEYGANAAEGLGRCMNNESFYFRLIKMAVDDPSFNALETAIAANDLDSAFEEAHKLKGVLGNLSLTPMYDPLVTLTELLRHKTPGDYAALCNTVMVKRAELAELLKN